MVAVGALFFMGGDKQQAEEGDENKPSAEVKVGKDYYVLVTLMEFHPKKNKRREMGCARLGLGYFLPSAMARQDDLQHGKQCGERRAHWQVDGLGCGH